MTTPANVLAAGDLRRLLNHVYEHRNPTRDVAIVLLSFKAGLRAGEIAGLAWSMVLQPNGRLADSLQIAGRIAKNGHGRCIPLHDQLLSTLSDLHAEYGKPFDGPVIRSERGAHMTPRSIVNWFAQAYAELGMSGCSSHSGRRTFITRSARLLARSGGSLRDIQELAGHRSLTTTERYIAGNRDAQRKLMKLI
ncbi:MAG: integrase family protein [Sphingomonadales bacterium]|nr:integrase family protein [Sphingomonadales bacterium]